MTSSFAYQTSLSPEQVEQHVLNAQEMRSRMVAAWLGSIADRVTGLWRTPATPSHPTAEVAANALAAIRASAEHLRDAPEMSAADRARFVHIVLEEETRLERLLNDLRVRPQVA